MDLFDSLGGYYSFQTASEVKSELRIEISDLNYICCHWMLQLANWPYFVNIWRMGIVSLRPDSFAAIKNRNKTHYNYEVSYRWRSPSLQVVASLGREINLNPPLVLGQLPDTSEELLKLDQVPRMHKELDFYLKRG